MSKIYKVQMSLTDGDGPKSFLIYDETYAEMAIVINPELQSIFEEFNLKKLYVYGELKEHRLNIDDVAPAQDW